MQLRSVVQFSIDTLLQCTVTNTKLKSHWCIVLIIAEPVPMHCVHEVHHINPLSNQQLNSMHIIYHYTYSGQYKHFKRLSIMREHSEFPALGDLCDMQCVYVIVR